MGPIYNILPYTAASGCASGDVMEASGMAEKNVDESIGGPWATATVKSSGSVGALSPKLVARAWRGVSCALPCTK